MYSQPNRSQYKRGNKRKMSRRWKSKDNKIRRCRAMRSQNTNQRQKRHFHASSPAHDASAFSFFPVSIMIFAVTSNDSPAGDS